MPNRAGASKSPGPKTPPAKGAAGARKHRPARTPATRQVMRPRGGPVRIETPPALPSRRRDGHKATFGHVLALAGSSRYTGAAVLTGRAVLRSGSGLVTIGCPASAHAAIAGHLLCEMSIAFPDAPPGVFSPEAISEALDRTERVQAVALGPGITTAVPAAKFAQEMAHLCPLPMVIDADGLNAFAGAAQRLELSEGPRVLTPHPGEAARMLGCPTEEVNADREAAAVRLARETMCVVLLKGAGTVVTDADRIYVNRSGNSGMATAGSGDVLTGVIAALLAQGMEAFDATVLGAYLHGVAGDHAAARLGEHGMMATDILDELPVAFRDHTLLR